MLDKERIYGYAKAYLKSQITLLSYKIKEEEEECGSRVGNAYLLQTSLNQYEDDLRELERIMEEQDYE